MKTAETDLIPTVARTGLGPQSHSGVTLGIGDDAALFTPRRGYETVLTCDWFLEGTHFLGDQHPADAVGWKCLARAASDIAAMGAEPRCFLLSLALPATHTGRWLKEFLGGLRRAARKLQCPLAGGDTTRQSKVLINITVVGEVSSGHALLRSGAKPGDVLYVSGRLGEADLGLQALRNPRRVRPSDPILRKHLYPEARIALGRWLAENRIATAMMDISDGLSTDLPRLCRASGVGARIDASRIPTVHVPRWNHAKNIDALHRALHGGDDYELLFTVRPNKAHRLPRVFQGLPLTAIGEITRKRNFTLVQPNGREEALHARGWDPFRKA